MLKTKQIHVEIEKNRKIFSFLIVWYGSAHFSPVNYITQVFSHKKPSYTIYFCILYLLSYILHNLYVSTPAELLYLFSFSTINGKETFGICIYVIWKFWRKYSNHLCTGQAPIYRNLTMFNKRYTRYDNIETLTNITI